LGFADKPCHADVQQVVGQALVRIQSHGKAAGILSADASMCKRYLDFGATFVTVGSDVGLLVNTTRASREQFP